MGEDSDALHAHVDHVIEETYQLERRVFELLMLNVARRAGVEVEAAMPAGQPFRPG